MIQAVFVYGTLKQGQCRFRLWPSEPQSIVPAWTRGSLFGRRDYPAMVAGEDRVIGELWRFEQADVQRVLTTLDEIEGTNQPEMEDLYVRVEIEAWSLDDRPLEPAYAYHYATDPAADGFIRLQPHGNDASVQWPASQSDG